MDSCVRAYSTVQQLLCHGGYCEIILSLVRTLCRLLFTARPTDRSLAGNLLRDVVHSRNPSESTLAHDAVATAVLHKQHLIIRVEKGLASLPGTHQTSLILTKPEHEAPPGRLFSKARGHFAGLVLNLALVGLLLGLVCINYTKSAGEVISACWGSQKCLHVG